MIFFRFCIVFLFLFLFVFIVFWGFFGFLLEAMGYKILITRLSATPDAMGRRTDLSWWTHGALVRQCSTTGVTSCLWDGANKRTLAAYEKSST